MHPPEFEAILRKTLDDRQLTDGERKVLTEIIAEAANTVRDRRVFRHLAFEAARARLSDPRATEVLTWLEEVNKLLLPPTNDGEEIFAEAFFSPGEDCLKRILALINDARRTLDVCVFTITDNRITQALLNARVAKIAVRIITDDEKATDIGSDIESLRAAGIPVRVDCTPDFMHHKYAVADERIVLTGSYNWTNSAAAHNQENLIATNDRRLVRAFHTAFEKLWLDLA